MATRKFYVAPAPTGNDTADGSKATPWATWAKSESTATNPGDVTIGFPGTYREMPTQGHSGGNRYEVGTISLTNGSTVVTGSGTTFTGNVFGGGPLGGSSILKVNHLISGTDGATNGTDGTLSSAAGNFQASLVTQFASGADGVTTGTNVMTSAEANFDTSLIGRFVTIGALGNFIISAVGSTTSLTVTNPDGSAATLGAGSGQAYSIWVGQFIRIGGLGTYMVQSVASATSMLVCNINSSAVVLALGTGRTYSIGPESPHDVLSVDSNTQLTLTEAWNGPTLTGVSYYCYQPCRWIGDYSGALTGATPGPVRITASDDDKTSTRAYSINAHNFHYRSYKGFLFDFGGTANIGFATGCHDVVFENCYFGYMSTTGGKLAAYDAGMVAWTVRNCYFTVAYNQYGIDFHYSAAGDDGCCIVELCIFECGNTNTYGVHTSTIGDCLVRNNLIIGALWGVSSRSQNLGHATICYNNIICNAYGGFDTNNAANLCEDYNSVSGPFNNGLFSGGVAQGPHTNKYPPLRDPRWFFELVNDGAGPNNASQVVSAFDLSVNSQVTGMLTFNPTPTDMRGTAGGTPGPLKYDTTLKVKGGSGLPRIIGG